MKKTVKSIFAAGLAGIMMTGTAFAGTWEASFYSPINKRDRGSFADGSQYQNYQTSIKVYSGFVDDRSQASLIDTGWKYKKDNGTYATSEWIQDEVGEYYVRQTGVAAQGWTTIKEDNYWFEPKYSRMVTDAIIELDFIDGKDIQYTLNEDGSWNFVSQDGSNIKNYQYHQFYYCGEDGILISDGAVPGGTINNNKISNVVKGIDENGVPFLTVGNVSYVAQESVSRDTTYEQNLGGKLVKNAEHEFYTIYVRQK